MTIPTRRIWGWLPFPDGLAGLVFALFLVPAPFEIALIFVKGEDYDPTRLGVVIGALVLLTLGLVVTRRPRMRTQSTIAALLIVVGALMFAIGFTITVYTQAVFVSPGIPGFVETTVSALTPPVGALLVIAGIYLIWAENRRIKARFEVEPVADIAAPPKSMVNNHFMAVWRSPAFKEQRSAEAVVDIAKKWVDPKDLHYIALYDARGNCMFYVDILDDGAMGRFNVADTARRRQDYEQSGRYIRRIIADGDQRFTPIESGLLVRAVLDVERGALYFYKLRNQGFIIGVTLDQSEVDPTDRKMSMLANEILVSRGGRPDDDFYRDPDYNTYDRKPQSTDNPVVTAKDEVQEARERRQAR